MPDERKNESTTVEFKALTLKAGDEFDPSKWLWGKVLSAKNGEVRLRFAREIDKPLSKCVESPA
jgi:hypothetical protein